MFAGSRPERLVARESIPEDVCDLTNDGHPGHSGHSAGPAITSSIGEPSLETPVMTAAGPPDDIEKACAGPLQAGNGSLKERMSTALQEKERQQRFLDGAQKKRPIGLLDLPIDVLHEIIKEVTHTNDLTSLALTHSALHELAIPYIYSRFDIVWPDAHPAADPRAGVDALTYGLATLVMDESLFSYNCLECARAADPRSGTPPVCRHNTTVMNVVGTQRRGNRYARYTRKFSLGNGPSNWVSDYLITKESGKMLGTLIALAVARMHNLESFVWDMPTGVLRDVWIALSSLANGSSQCNLQRVWIRWHDNTKAKLAEGVIRPSPASSSTLMPHPPPVSTSIGYLAPLTAGLQSNFSPLAAPTDHLSLPNHIEYPNFSILPPLASLSVLDIDELAYLDEMSVLIGRSQDRLQELRVGIASQAMNREWVHCWDGGTLSQVDLSAKWPAQSGISHRRLGGVLGVILGRVYDLRRARLGLSAMEQSNNAINPVSPPPATPSIVSGGSIAIAGIAESLPTGIVYPAGTHPPVEPFDFSNIFSSVSQISLPLHAHSDSTSHTSIEKESTTTALTDMGKSSQAADTAHSSSTTPEASGSPIKGLATKAEITCAIPKMDGKLKLTTLELERVPLCVPLLRNVIDWTRLTTLTILGCPNHEQLWRSLRRTFGPSDAPSNIKRESLDGETKVKGSVRSRIANVTSVNHTIEFSLKLRRIHTDAVTPSLINFLRDALAPNSLEVLLLQDSPLTSSSVSVNAIYRGILKRHRTSLRKVLIDSGSRVNKVTEDSDTADEDDDDDEIHEVDEANSLRWKKWMFNREALTFITSGKMSNLRELGLSLDYKDWHFFLQRLPSIPHLRSIYVPHLADHVYGTSLDARELAMQVLDIVTLRPEIQLCYMGITTKCFEIMEIRKDEPSLAAQESYLQGGSAGPTGLSAADDENGAPEGSTDDGLAEGAVEESAETDSEMAFDAIDDSTDDEEEHSADKKRSVKLRLREILFYDDKVAIFKARYGRL